MKKLLLVIPLVAAAALWLLVSPQPGASQQAAMPNVTSFLVLFGIADSAVTQWDGSVRVTGGSISRIEGWRFAAGDSTDNQQSWKLASRPPVIRNAKKKGPGKKGLGAATADNGVVIAASLQDPNAAFTVSTSQGDFSFKASEVTFADSREYLNGRVRVERVPNTAQLTDSPEDQDHPALARSGDDVWLAYVEFTHGDRSQAVPQQMREEPKSFAFLARPAGGDQVKLMHYSISKRNWTQLEAPTPSGQDLMRVALAVDGSKRVWAIWSANRQNNFDLYARSLENGKWSPEVRITSSAGQDLNPVAATDSNGRVWVAWQGYRNGNLDVLVAAADGTRFTPEQRISTSQENDWDPSIAAGSNGEVAVAWDTYDKGDYDIYLRRVRFNSGIKADPPVAIAASQNFEARPSLAFDARNRIWIAYEGSDVKWGKDFGAYETTGIGLYQGHNLRIRTLEGQTLSTTSDDLAAALPGGALASRRRRAQQQSQSGTQQPNPELARSRPPSGTPQPPPLAKNSFPRLVADSTGNVFLAYRYGTPYRFQGGPVWREQLAVFNGSEWQGSIEVPHSDGFMDLRPALVSTAEGKILMVGASDGRQSGARGRRSGTGLDNDLWAAELAVAAPARTPALKAIGAETPAPADPDSVAERQQIALMRKHRVDVAGKKLQLVRGEFHRHTELSGDGGMSDGPIIDAYRYMLDAAAMDWGGCCDHDNGGLEYYWWIAQKLTDAYNLPGRYTAMFSYERSVRYPEGHRNTVMARRGIRPLPRLAKMDDDSPPANAPDTQMLYRYLRHFDGIVASHTSGTDMGTDWRDNDPIVEPVVEIYQGDRQNYELPGAPRSNSSGDSIGGWRPLGFVSLALQKGYKLGFQASSDHVSTHMSYCNLWVADRSREAVLDAFKKRRVYGATDNILADVRVGTHFMGEEFTVSTPPVFEVKLWGTAPFKEIQVIKDGKAVYSTKTDTKTADFRWRDDAAARGSNYYYVRGEQTDGELVWVSPMWITYR